MPLRLGLILLLWAFCIPPAVLAGEGEVREPQPFEVRDFTYPLRRGLALGPVALHGYVSEFASYDSNLFLDKSSVKSDVVFDTLFGIRGDIFFGNHLLSLGFDGEYLYALKNSGFNRFNYQGTLLGKLEFPDFYMDLEASWVDRTEPENTRVVAWNMTRRQDLNLSLETGLELGRLAVELGGAFYMRSFAKDDPQTLTIGTGTVTVDRDYLNHFETNGHLRLAYVWSKLRIFVGGSFGLVSFSDDIMHNYTYLNFIGGASLKITEKVDAELVVGYSMQTVQDLNASGSLTDTDEFSGLVGSFNLLYYFSRKFMAKLYFVQALQFSGASNYQVFDSLSLAVKHQILPRLSWSLAFGADYIDPSDNYNYTILHGYALADWRVFDWAGLGLKVDFRNRLTNYENQKYTAFTLSAVLTLFL